MKRAALLLALTACAPQSLPPQTASVAASANNHRHHPFCYPFRGSYEKRCVKMIQR